jgi:hypothetical protein
MKMIGQSVSRCTGKVTHRIEGKRMQLVARPCPAVGMSPRSAEKAKPMRSTIGSYLTAGATFVTAGAIALSPISPVTPSLSDIHMQATHATSSLAVQLAAIANPTGNPITVWAEFLTNTAGSLGALGGQVLGNGAPVLTQLIANQMGYGAKIGAALQATGSALGAWGGTLPTVVRTAFDQFRAGQIYDAVSTLLSGVVGAPLALFPMLPILDIPGAMAQNFANVMQQIPSAVMGLGLSALTAFEDPILAFGAQAQSIVNAVSARDLLGAVKGVLNTPAVITDAILNGYLFHGLLGPFHTLFNTGLIAGLLVGIPQLIANAIKPVASALGLLKPAGPASVESAPAITAAASPTSEIAASTAASAKRKPDAAKRATDAASVPVASAPAVTLNISEVGKTNSDTTDLGTASPDPASATASAADAKDGTSATDAKGGATTSDVSSGKTATSAGEDSGKPAASKDGDSKNSTADQGKSVTGKSGSHRGSGGKAGAAQGSSDSHSGRGTAKSGSRHHGSAGSGSGAGSGAAHHRNSPGSK